MKTIMNRDPIFSIRRASTADAVAISKLIAEAVLRTNARDYSPIIIQKVINNFTSDKVATLTQERQVFIATLHEQVVGTASLDGEKLVLPHL